MKLLSDKFEISKADIQRRHSDDRDPRALDLFKPYEGEKVEFGLLGVPFDGAVKGRPGARHAPDGIREAFRFYSTYNYEHDVDVSGMKVADFGNVVLSQENVKEAHSNISSALKEMLGVATVPLIMGGDHSITFATVKALSEVTEGNIGIITFDSHNDVREYEDDDISSGTPFRRILEELEGEPVKGKNIVQIGLHGFLNSSYYRDYAISKGMMIFTADVVRTMGMENVVKGALMQAGDGTDAIYLSVDMDSVDQSEAPGVSAPSPGGLSSSELLNGIFHVASDSKVKAMDIVELAPPLDPSGTTARLGANALLYFLGGKARNSG